MTEPVTVVGIGADGWPGLAQPAQLEVRAAQVLLGSSRQLDLVPDKVTAERVAWPSPMLPALPGLLERHRGRRICVLASGDPMFFGVGSTLARLLGPQRLRVLPHASSISLACARLGWPMEAVDVVSAVGRPVELLHPFVQPGRRVLVLSAGGGTPAEVAALLTVRGYGPSRLTVLERLGGKDERLVSGTAGEWSLPRTAALNVIAVDCVADPGTPLLPTVPGLPDSAFDHDGQLTKREVRALTLSRLAPVPGQLLWDVGAGAGSVAIEWSRTHPSCRAVAVEREPERAERITRNAYALGVPGIEVVLGEAPSALDGLEAPSAVFVGGGATGPGVIEKCWQSLLPGGRLVVNAVTVESESLVAQWYARLGGDLLRMAISRAAPVGGFTAMRPMLPVTTWVATKEER
ncbi:precorrin-6y C5,15-methyltransferase (decarboxylating) subunit CbiE [Crossiella sp. CA-258035]|uniref:precorrin-6y C5,15-methyltransferase (decarboxylating) subunit CbiE n=1 Tax=Crossiella sp. CA-258035 TaxID=2981138 RepID=UPI0024BCF8E1|nr:precorrin-6y C5,15-methyltransferase (decarboxylating) subunit CbiE [Crossiella sp. CA-258035]WHT17620.1 precorrin-6y C5,15-methyltransferase (decarboxylating) subunit CbiE [Crossiella sp. CA-258035]